MDGRGRGIEPQDKSLRQLLEGLKLHDHLCLIYESPQERLEVAVPFIATGLGRGEKCIYLVDISTADEIRSRLKGEGIDVAAAERTGQLSILHESKAYTRGGYFDPDRMIALLIEETEGALSQGYPAIRVTGEMTWVLRRLPGSEKLLEYEAKLNRDYFPRYPALAICQYDRWKFDAEALKGVVMTHPLLIKGNRIYHNFYYVPPEDFLSQKIAEVEVQHWLNNLEREHRMQAELRQSEERYRTLTEQSPAGVLVVGEGFRILYANPAMTEITGYSREELYSLTPEGVQALVHPEDRGLVWGRFQQRLAGGEPPQHYECRGIRKDGGVTWLEMCVSRLEYEGRPSVRATIIDMTERKRLEEELKASEHEKSIILSAMSELVVRQDVDHRILWANRAAAASVNLTPEELVGHYCHQIWHQRSQPCTGCPVEKALETGEPQEGEMTTPDGRRWLIRGYPVKDASGKVVELVEVTMDITERKRTEEALKLSEERYRLIAENTRDVIVTTDMDLKVTYISPSARYLGGRSPEEVLATPPEELLTPASLREARKVLNEELERARTQPAEPGRSRTLELEVLHKDGSTLWAEGRVSFLRNAEGQPVGLIGVLRDITERKRTEEELRTSESRFRTVLEEVDEGYYEIDLRGNYTFVSDAIVRQLGYSKEELIGMNYRKYVPPEEWDPVFRAFNGVYRTGQPLKRLAITNITKDGRRILVEDTVLPLRNEKGEIVGFRGVSRDVTEQKKAEEERRQLELRAQMASRLATVGEMAAGIAHEINNPLTGVVGYAQLLLTRQDLPEDVRRDLKVINDGAQRVAGIVQRLLAFSRQTKPERRLVNVNQLIESTLALRAYSLRTSNIEVTTNLDPYLPDTVVDPGQIQQVLINLIVNAEQALKQVRRKGKLTITTRQKDNTIQIEVRDNGPGIKPEIMDRIFDPFFTTRPAGEGTGLGLSLCYGIVAEHNGRIRAESELGRGATFTVELPVATEVVRPFQLPIELKVDLTGARILVVDDEPVIRELVATALGEQGCQVDTAARPEEALAKIEGNGYDLVLIDVKMPGTSGIELYHRIRRMSRRLARRVVFVTGDVISPETTRFLSENKLLSLAKPFTATELVDKVRQALSGRR